MSTPCFRRAAWMVTLVLAPVALVSFGCNAGGDAGGGGGGGTAGELFTGMVTVENDCGCNADGDTDCEITMSAGIDVSDGSITIASGGTPASGTIDNAGNYSVTVTTLCLFLSGQVPQDVELTGTLNENVSPRQMTVQWDEVICGCRETAQGTLTEQVE